MPITTLPTQTEDAGELGQAKTNAVPYTAPASQISAEIWNALVERVIEAHTEIGLSDGSTAGSLRAAIAALSSGPSPAGSVYWEWNGADTTQFGSSLGYETDAGTAPTGTLALSVVAAPFGGGNALRLTGTSVGGGYFRPINDLPGGVLPARFAIEYMLAGLTVAGNGGPSFMLFASDTTNVIDGVSFDQASGVTNNDLALIYNNEKDTAITLFAGVSFAPAAVSRGVPTRIECWRQTGTNPHAWHVSVSTIERSNQTGGNASSVSDGSTAAARFASKNMNLCGPGLYSGGSAFTGTVDLVGLRIIDLDA